MFTAIYVMYCNILKYIATGCSTLQKLQYIAIFQYFAINILHYIGLPPNYCNIEESANQLFALKYCNV